MSSLQLPICPSQLMSRRFISHLTFPLLNIECQSNFVLKTDCLKDKSFNKAWHRPDPPPLGNARILYFVLLFLFIPVYWKGFLKKLHLKQSFGCLTFCVASPAGLISNKLTFSLLAEKWDWRQLTICHSVGQPAKPAAAAVRELQRTKFTSRHS